MIKDDTKQTQQGSLENHVQEASTPVVKENPEQDSAAQKTTVGERIYRFVMHRA